MYFRSKHLKKTLRLLTSALTLVSVSGVALGEAKIPPEPKVLQPALPTLAPAASGATAPFKRIDALKDPDHRISKDFAIPRNLRLRTAFWFDIYTKYGSHEFVIHHALYPWIVFKVVNTNPIFATHINKWVKYDKEKKTVRHQMELVHSALLRLAKYGRRRHLTWLDRSLIADLRYVRGSRRHVYQEAADNLRVQLGQRDFFISGLEQSTRYLPFMEKEFTANGLPVELTRLPFVESSFNVKAESKVGASGIWQLMPHTGREFLFVNNRIDERNSPFKSSLVAIELFKQNHRKFRSWPLAITAYNHGWQGLRDAIRATHTKNLGIIIRRYHEGAFKFASANFYTCFLAALHAEMYHKEIFTDVKTAEPPVDFKVVTLERRTRIKRLVHKLGISADDLLTYNLDLKHAMQSNSLLPKGYDLILPTQFDQQLEKTFVHKNRILREAELRVHTQRSSG